LHRLEARFDRVGTEPLEAAMNHKFPIDRRFGREREAGEPLWRVDEDRALQSPDQEFETSAPYSEPRDFPSQVAGPQSGGSPSNDERVRRDIWDRLNYSDEVDANEVSVRVENGEVTLEGTVESRAMRGVAEDIAAKVPGVTAVRNALRVEPSG
jgi:hypothetical protein